MNENSVEQGLVIPKPSRASIIKRYLKLLTTIVIGFFLLSTLSVILYRFVPVPYTPLMFWKSTVSLVTGPEPLGMNKKWVPITEINPSIQRAVIRAEDAKFYIHHGFDFEAIQAAVKYNKTHKKQKGASTISQQTAKNVFLWPSRSWIRKGMEVYFTVMIEALWSKQRILEVYLNVIELGPGVYGVEAASQKYFHKKAKGLSNRESSLMAAVLPNPIKFKINKPSAYILRRQRKIMGGGPVITVAPKVEETKEFLDIKLDDEENEPAAPNEKGAADTSTEAAPQNSNP
jgi:monofunctional biosynthetic peptidoglycan transglycosylase